MSSPFDQLTENVCKKNSKNSKYEIFSVKLRHTRKQTMHLHSILTNFLLLPQLLRLFLIHRLNLHGPAGEITLLNRIEQILGRVIRGNLGSLLRRQVLGPLVRDQMELHVNPLAVLVDQLQGVSIVPVHETPTKGNTSITEQDHGLMDRLWVLGEVIPEIGRVGISIQVGLGITLLSVDEDGELGRVSEEEDGSVVGDKVPITLARLELDRESTRVTVGIRRAGLSTDGRESGGQGDLGSLLEHVGETKILESIGTFENSMSSTSKQTNASIMSAKVDHLHVNHTRHANSPLGVNNTLGNPLSVKVTEQVDQVEILEQQRSVLAGSLNLVGV